MALILKNLTAITTSCHGKLLSWKERGIVLGEFAVEATGNQEDERICFAVEAKHNVCLAGATRFGSFYPELRLPVTPYIVEMQQGTVTFRRPVDTLPETVIMLARHLQKFLRRQLDDENSFESLTDELNSCRTQFIRRTVTEQRVRQALQLLEMAFDKRLKNRLRRYALWQEIRAEMETMRSRGTGFIEEFYFNHAPPVASAEVGATSSERLARNDERSSHIFGGNIAERE